MGAANPEMLTASETSSKPAKYQVTANSLASPRRDTPINFKWSCVHWRIKSDWWRIASTTRLGTAARIARVVVFVCMGKWSASANFAWAAAFASMEGDDTIARIALAGVFACMEG
jgi:hypothetical protein